jgi:hypothetical protein
MIKMQIFIKDIETRGGGGEGGKKLIINNIIY